MEKEQSEESTRRVWIKFSGRLNARFAIHSTLALSVSNTLAVLILAFFMARQSQQTQVKQDTLGTLPSTADFALVRRVSELESEIVTLEDQIAALTKELRASYTDPNPPSLKPTQDDKGTSPNATARNRPTKRFRRNADSLRMPPDISALHLVNLHDSMESDKGIVRDWRIIGTEPRHRLHRKQSYELEGEGGVIRMREDGLFLIYAQLYFESGPGMTNRFDIEVRSGDKNPKVVASCAAMSPGDRKVSKGSFSDGDFIAEQSCFTLAAVSVSAGDGVYLRMSERGRDINTRDGKSFFGAVRLAMP